MYFVHFKYFLSGAIFGSASNTETKSKGGKKRGEISGYSSVYFQSDKHPTSGPEFRLQRNCSWFGFTKRMSVGGTKGGARFCAGHTERGIGQIKGTKKSLTDFVT